MNFDVIEEFNLPEDVCNIERKFRKFYLEVIKNYFDLDENFHYPMNRIANRRKQTDIKNDFRFFNNPKDLLLLCIEDTGLALRKFFSSLGEYVEIAKYFSKKNLVTIYCVTCESLFSAIGVSTVIDATVEQYGVSVKISRKSIQIIVTDKRENWRLLCSYKIERVNLCFKNVEIKLNFTDEPSDRLSVEVFRTLKEIDVVVMARYLSVFHYLTVKTHFLEVILNRMKELSILYYVDENHEIYYNTMKHLISKTDTLVEIMNKETVYEPLDDFENTEYCSEFRFLCNADFKPVMFSTCIKCSGIKDKPSRKNNTIEYVPPCAESRSRIKQKILERFRKENSLPQHLDSPEAKYLKIPSKSFLNVPTHKNNHKTTSEVKNVKKSSKKAENTNICPLTSQITSCNQKNNTKLVDMHNPTDRHLFSAVSTVQSCQKTIRDTETSRENKAFEKLQSAYKYSEEKKKPNDETIKTSKAVNEFVSKNPRNKHKYSGEGKKQNTEVVKTNKAMDKSHFTNSQNKYIYHGEGNTWNAECVKSSKISGKSTAINPENMNKQLKINKRNTETAKSSKDVAKSATSNLKTENEMTSEINKANAGNIKRNQAVGMLVTMNLRCKYTNSEEEITSPNADDLTANKSAQNTASTKLENKTGYRSPHLRTEKSLSRYANHLSDIYYSKYVDKEKSGAPKLK